MMNEKDVGTGISIELYELEYEYEHVGALLDPNTLQ